MELPSSPSPTDYPGDRRRSSASFYAKPQLHYPHKSSPYDVLVIGSGAAGLTAALSARAHGATRVLLIDKCPPDWAGGNGYFTAGAYRTIHNGLEDLWPLIENNAQKSLSLEPYTMEKFRADIDRVTAGRTDHHLSDALITESLDVLSWLKWIARIPFALGFHRQAYVIEDKWKFWGGLALTVDGGGKGLIGSLLTAARAKGVDLLFDTPATQLVTDEEGGKGVTGILVQMPGGSIEEIRATSVILCAGGFEANPRMRAQYLGPGWDLAYVRGSPYNTGEMLEIAIRDANAKQMGNWSGCHSVAWDANAPTEEGDQEKTNEFTKSGYPLGLMLNSHGNRFVDEGMDLRNYTYAKFGKEILHQPDGIAFQVWDAQTLDWLRPEEYRDETVRKIYADSVEELAQKCGSLGLVDGEQFVRTIEGYNDAVYASQRENPGRHWDPAVKDGLSTQSSSRWLNPPKSNWALPLDQPPFVAVKVTAGITFTFGGLAINPNTAGVLSRVTGKDIPGLYCAGEMVGGLFYENYPGGSGLTAGAVFGRKAGRSAAALALSRKGSIPAPSEGAE
ncbi:FAD binding domain-containing protein [Xylona heveae TC161]|uniref:FAD binding domain-containing protein n=1 Tax=Xylona heveae (strain CBS 132557 / TC161) TaxID=1328760 RepID=A0A165H3L3_XYLHT|nr:FAD binding domain-containing protein [Xylona heveae TC161]KZF22938.1 FAD binding domain-containing protein [Xylona heveae TC161]